MFNETSHLMFLRDYQTGTKRKMILPKERKSAGYQDIAPRIFDLSKKKSCSVQITLLNNFWVSQIDTHHGITLEHLQEFITLWEKLSSVTLNNSVQDTIHWKFTSQGEYSTSTAYMAQFAGHTTSIMPAAVWKVWAPPKCKFFAWLIIQNRVWTADRLLRRGWPNCNPCPLCKQVQETAAHLLFQCRFSQRVWVEVATWIGLNGDVVRSWRFEASVRDWWIKNVIERGNQRKAIASLFMLMSWEI